MKGWLVWIVGLLVCIYPMTVAAHVLESDGSIGAVMHVTEDDDPIVGDLSQLTFEIKDKAGEFSLADCNCNLVIAQGEGVIFSAAWPASAVNGAVSFYYTFATKGVYSIRVEGTSKQAGLFQPFTLTYDLRVTREGTGQETVLSWLSVHAVHLGVVALAAGWVVGFTLWDKRRETMRLKRL